MLAVFATCLPLIWSSAVVVNSSSDIAPLRMRFGAEVRLQAQKRTAPCCAGYFQTGMFLVLPASLLAVLMRARRSQQPQWEW